MSIADDLVLKQAMVKFCTQLELASAFVHKVGCHGMLIKFVNIECAHAKRLGLDKCLRIINSTGP